MLEMNEIEQFLNRIIEKQKLVIDSCTDYVNFLVENEKIFNDEKMETFVAKEFHELNHEMVRLGNEIINKFCQSDWNLNKVI